MTRDLIRPTTRWVAIVSAAVACLLAAVEIPSFAQSASPIKPATRPTAEQGTSWSDLKPAQREALRPLEHEWATIEPRTKQKWLLLSTRFPKMSEDERARVQDRMSDWTRLTPRERGEARLHFQEAKQLPQADRQARWKAYEALTPEQKRQFAARAAPAAMLETAPKTVGTASVISGARSEKAIPQPKSNIVPNPSFTAPPTNVAPTVVRARPGATTSLITKRASPPSHQQTGMPKIAATPEFVDAATLLPQRGPQGAAVRPAAAPATSRE
jgi:hypothetical protein